MRGTRRMFPLVRYFSITSLIAFIGVTALLGILYRQTAIRDLLALRENNNVALTQAFANSLWPDIAPFVASAFSLTAEQLQAHPRVAEMREAVLEQMAGLSV